MGRARIRAILAVLRPPGVLSLPRGRGVLLRSALAGLLIVTLLLSVSVALPAAAAGQGLAAGPHPIAAEPVRAGDAQPCEGRADFAMTTTDPPAGKDRRHARWRPDRAAPAAVVSSAAGMPAPPGRRIWRVLSAADSRSWPALLEPQTLSRVSAPSEHPSSLPASADPRAPTTRLERRLRQWPAWQLPAPLVRPGRQAPSWPAWFSGEWQVESVALSPAAAETLPSSPPWRARFRPDGHGAVVADRAYNAFSVGRSLLGERLLSVQDDPANPQRQLARLGGDQMLETTLIGQRGESPQQDYFLNDELSLQVLHGPGEPRLSRIETLGQWRRLADGSIAGEQWQARYASPGEGLAAAALSSDHWRIRLVPVPPESDRATGTTEPAEGYR